MNTAQHAPPRIKHIPFDGPRRGRFSTFLPHRSEIVVAPWPRAYERLVLSAARLAPHELGAALARNFGPTGLAAPSRIVLFDKEVPQQVDAIPAAAGACELLVELPSSNRKPEAFAAALLQALEAVRAAKRAAGTSITVTVFGPAMVEIRNAPVGEPSTGRIMGTWYGEALRPAGSPDAWITGYLQEVLSGAAAVRIVTDEPALEQPAAADAVAILCHPYAIEAWEAAARELGPAGVPIEVVASQAAAGGRSGPAAGEADAEALKRFRTRSLLGWGALSLDEQRMFRAVRAATLM